MTCCVRILMYAMNNYTSFTGKQMPDSYQVNALYVLLFIDIIL
jgi:hypothetical protein